MTATRWKRNIRKVLMNQLKEARRASRIPRDRDYKVERVRPRQRKKRHPGYTIIPGHRLWIFEK